MIKLKTILSEAPEEKETATEKVFEVAEKKLGMFKRKVLFIDTDASGGAWKSMAQKLGVEYEAN